VVEEKVARKGAGPAVTKKEFRAEGEGRISNNIRPIQVLNLESRHPSYQDNHFRSAPAPLFKSTQGIRPYGWAVGAADTSSADEAGAQLGVFTSVSQSFEYNDTKVAEQGDCFITKSWIIFGSTDVSFSRCSEIRW
jgi:hypothetical protein